MIGCMHHQWTYRSHGDKQGWSLSNPATGGSKKKDCSNTHERSFEVSVHCYDVTISLHYRNMFSNKFVEWLSYAQYIHEVFCIINLLYYVEKVDCNISMIYYSFACLCSRSHTLFMVTIKTKENSLKEFVKIGKFNLVGILCCVVSLK